MIIPEIRRWVILGLCVAALCFLFAILTMCNGRADDRARNQTANATGKALDTVTRETEIIQTDTTEKRREVDEIQGSDVLLPDGYGADLERVRRNERRNP